MGWLLPGLPGTVLIYSCCLGRIINYAPFSVQSLCLDDKLYRRTFLEVFLLLTIMITLFRFSAAFSVSTQSLTKCALVSPLLNFSLRKPASILFYSSLKNLRWLFKYLWCLGLFFPLTNSILSSPILLTYSSIFGISTLIPFPLIFLHSFAVLPDFHTFTELILPYLTICNFKFLPINRPC